MSVDLVRIVDSIHRDKNIAKEILFEGIESALATAKPVSSGHEGRNRPSIVVPPRQQTTKSKPELPGATSSSRRIEDRGRIGVRPGRSLASVRLGPHG